MNTHRMLPLFKLNIDISAKQARGLSQSELCKHSCRKLCQVSSSLLTFNERYMP